MKEAIRSKPGDEIETFVRWTILSVTTLSSFMVAVDSNIVTIALPVMGAELSSGVSLLGWIITGYILTTAALLLQFGKIGDKYGRKRIYLIGFAIFGIASALCGLSQNVYELIAFRLVQGAGAAALGATSYPLIFESFPARQRGAAMGINSIAWAVGAVAGPVAGGFLVSIDWRLIFYINVPIAAAAVLIGMRRIPARLDQGSPSVRRINPLSSLLLAFTVALLLIWLTFFNYLFAIIGAVGLAALFISERRSGNPLLNRELTKSKGFIYTVASLAVTNLGILGIPFALTFYYQLVVRASPIMTGLFIVPLSIASVLSNPIAGKLFDRMKTSAALSMIGTGIDGVATIALSIAVLSQTTSLYIDVLLAVIGIGSGFVWTPLVGNALKFAKPELRGVANGTSFTLVNLGFAASIAILVAVSATFLPQSVVSHVYFGNFIGLSIPQITLLNHGIARSILVLGIIDLLALPLLAVVLRQQRKSF
ncbi:MAG: MFS transporter [Nitrososphaerales archaeon]